MGRDIWKKFISKHKNILLTLNGHIIFKKTRGNDGVGRLISEGIHGNKVFQIGSNYQQLKNGGNGFMRLMKFSEDGNTIRVKTYSPFLDQYKTDFKNEFVIDIDKEAFTQLN